jgi:hypothetical protein
LHDHLAGSNFAIDLLRSMRDHYPNESLGQLASAVLLELEEDRETLRRIVERVGKGSQALETLALGILGKLALWRALATLAEKDDRLRDLDFRELIARAEAQHAMIEGNRVPARSTQHCNVDDRVVFANEPSWSRITGHSSTRPSMRMKSKRTQPESLRALSRLGGNIRLAHPSDELAAT